MVKLHLRWVSSCAPLWDAVPGLAMSLFVLGILLGSGSPLSGETTNKPLIDPYRATTSRAARQSAVKSIPVEKLSAQSRAKVDSVLSRISVFRRMPIRVVDCDPHLYLFLVRHPDVVVNIWEVLKISSLKLRQIEPDKYRLLESFGTLATVEFLYHSHDTHVIYAEGSYDGPLFAKPVRGRCLMVLKSGYIREPDGRYYITTRLDTFVRVDHGGVEFLAKTFHPLIGKTADVNFVQTITFLGSLSRTAEVNTRGVQRLAARLDNISPEARLQLAKLVAGVAQKSTANSDRNTPALTRVASHGSDEEPKR